MRRADALRELNLTETAEEAEVERAYLRLVRRYPPEFNPERFQKIDEAYRFLTSLPDMIASLLSPTASEGVSPDDFLFRTELPPEAVDEAMACLLRNKAMSQLWPGQKK